MADASTVEPSLSEVSCELCTDSGREEWDDYVRSRSTATIGHLYGWRTVIEQAYGHASIYVLARRDGTVRGVLPLVLVRNRMLGSSLSSMPFLDIGGICADDSSVAEELIRQAQQLKQRSAASIVELRQKTLVPSLPNPRLDKVTMVLDLSVGRETVWKSLPAKVRNQVRKAEKSGLKTVCGGKELLPEFYRVFIVNMRDLGSPVHGLSFFSSMADVFGEQVQVMLIQDGGKTVGGLIMLHFRDAVFVPWASSLREYFSKCPNNLLYWEAIQHACLAGFRSFDFGRSSRDSGTYEFKRQWGAQPEQLYWYTLGIDAGAGTTIDGTSLKGRALREVWRRMPVGITAAVGPWIRRYLTN